MEILCYCPMCRPIGNLFEYTEAFRHQCEVRMLVKKPQEEREEWVKDVRRIRGYVAARRLIIDLRRANAWHSQK